MFTRHKSLFQSVKAVIGPCCEARTSLNYLLLNMQTPWANVAVNFRNKYERADSTSGSVRRSPQLLFVVGSHKYSSTVVHGDLLASYPVE